MTLHSMAAGSLLCVQGLVFKDLWFKVEVLRFRRQGAVCRAEDVRVQTLGEV